MKVLIAGGGIGGLSLGLSLHAAGINDVEVFEAAPSIEELGVGINVLPHAVREVTELGLADELSSAGLATGEFVMFNKHGQRIWGEPRGLAAGYRWPQYSIHRGRLLGVLYRAFVDRLGERRLHTDHRVVHATQDDTSVSVHLASGAQVVGDVLVGADGIHSAIRAQLCPGEGAPLWNGITMWRALAEAAPCLTGSSMVIIGHFGKRAVVYCTYAINPGRTIDKMMGIIGQRGADTGLLEEGLLRHSVLSGFESCWRGSRRISSLDRAGMAAITCSGSNASMSACSRTSASTIRGSSMQ
jgi:2-polyprenyl-6-methoxyphenol hydroxylase-like FAD-dependent oxidoreductase